MNVSGSEFPFSGGFKEGSGKRNPPGEDCQRDKVVHGFRTCAYVLFQSAGKSVCCVVVVR